MQSTSMIQSMTSCKGGDNMWQYNYANSSELCHFGIKGMKWGVRRNRTTTSSSSRRRDLNTVKKVVDSGSNLVNSTKPLVKPKTSYKSVNLSKMSDKELRDAVNRMNLERQYSTLVSSDTGRISKGAAMANKIVDNVGTALTITSSALGLALAIKELTGK